MTCSLRSLTHCTAGADGRRRGSAAVLAAVVLIVVMAFTAFAVDIGYILLAKSQLQGGSDAAALAAVLELPAALGAGAVLTSSQAEQAAREAAAATAALNRVADVSSIYLNGNRDVRFGRYQWDPLSGTWTRQWGVTPYNMAEVTLIRGEAFTANGQPNTGGDRPLSLFFAPLIGNDTANVSTKATAAFPAGVGFRITAQSNLTADILPIALDANTWNALLAGTGRDRYAYNPETGQVTSGADGILECNLYPEGTGDLPPGNRGTVDIGSPNNSTADIARQILYGVNAQDLAYHGGELRTDLGPIMLNGDTGLSAGIKDELASIRGRPRAIPIFTQVANPGNNAMYTIVKFVGIRIMDVKLTGPPNGKHVTIQPAPYYGAAVIPGSVQITQDSYFGKPILIP